MSNRRNKRLWNMEEDQRRAAIRSRINFLIILTVIVVCLLLLSTCDGQTMPTVQLAIQTNTTAITVHLCPKGFTNTLSLYHI